MKYFSVFGPFFGVRLFDIMGIVETTLLITRPDSFKTMQQTDKMETFLFLVWLKSLLHGRPYNSLFGWRSYIKFYSYINILLKSKLNTIILFLCQFFRCLLFNYTLWHIQSFVYKLNVIHSYFKMIIIAKSLTHFKIWNKVDYLS